MRKIEQCHKIGKKQAIIHKYPWWMKWLIKYIDCYYIPDVTNITIKEKEPGYLLKTYDSITLKKPPKSLSKIYEIT